MIKTILVPVAGSPTDRVVFETALAVARQLGGHLNFVHVRIKPSEALVHAPHADFAVGTAVRHALDNCEADIEARSLWAANHVHEFCDGHDIAVSDKVRGSARVSASWHEAGGDGLTRLLFHARHHDLIVMGRAQRSDGMPPDLLELLLVGCGRPMLLAPARSPRAPLRTAMVCWKETPEAARALGAAMPLLTTAERVVLVGIDEDRELARPALEHLAGTLAWHGIAAEVHPDASDRRSTAAQLSAAAHDCGADLMVMGGYSHSRFREVMFGGCTQAILEAAAIPVFILH